MTKDDIIQMTRQLGICELTSKPKQRIHYSLTIHEMQAFANLVLNKARATDVTEATFRARQQNEQLRATLQTISRIALANLSEDL